MTAVSTIAPARTRTAPTGPPRRIAPAPSVPAGKGRPEAAGSAVINGAIVAEPQHMQALARANEVRLARAEMKREIASGRRDVRSVIGDCPWEAESMTLGELLRAQRRWGRARSRKLINSVNLGETKQLASLTERQRQLLLAALERKSAA